MNALMIKKLYLLHGWVGVITGVLLFILAFSGIIAVFSRPELAIWGNPELRGDIQVNHQQLDALVSQYSQEVPPIYRDNIHIYYPGQRGNVDLVLMFESHDGDEVFNKAASWYFQFDAKSLSLVEKGNSLTRDYIANRDTDMARFLAEFHADLHLGRPVGLILTGLLGLTLMLSVVTGFVVHRQKIKQMFSFRRDKNASVVISDAHKIMGIWGSLFHFTIGFTGAFLGLAAVILLPAAAMVTFGGDQDKLLQAFTPMPEVHASGTHKTTELGLILKDIEKKGQFNVIQDITVMAYGDANAMVYVRAKGQELSTQLLKYQGNNGEFIKQFSVYGDLDSSALPLLDLILPLHTGNFGDSNNATGILIKLIWACLGLTTALLPLTGVMMWFDKRSRGAQAIFSQRQYLWANRLSLGLCAGLVLACVSLFAAQLLLGYFADNSRLSQAMGPIFFGVWILVSLLACLVPNLNAFAKLLWRLTALLLISLMPLNSLLTGSHLFNVMTTGHWLTLGVDSVCLLLGLSLLKIEAKVFNKINAQASSHGVTDGANASINADVDISANHAAKASSELHSKINHGGING
ncbi:PepSY domain-containing protein [Shewanella sp. SR44-3]|uniref:PepSY-associated TM helix domain-containing protein n=1 Tax=Shewanella sp. SR44-3 TaxID=2760936 RepID=UPI0015FD92CC|nr:PepSY-associated TM helix domain-containing protein [Shewanella sp. SR44-3]MBB1269930.1 PepSY domain-containing protein [Shewanella sp. SR44-3]